MRQSRRARRAAARQASRLLTLLALLGVLVILVAARASADDRALEAAPEPELPTVEVNTLAELHQTAPDTAPEPSESPEPTPIAEEDPSPYAGIALSDDEMYMLACLVWHEARGEPYEGQVAVAEVVLNRCLSASFPSTVSEVIFQRYPGQGYQFSPAPYLYSAQPDETQYAAVRDALDGAELIVPTSTVFFSTEPYNSNIVAVIGNHYFCTL